MAKGFGISIKNIDEVQKLVRETFNVAVKKKQMLVKVNNQVIERIQQFSRSGKSLVNERKSFPQVSDGYAKSRRLTTFQERNAPISSLFIADSRAPFSDISAGSRKSNITVTGQLLDSLKGKISNSRILIDVTGTRTWGDSKGVTNKDVRDELEARGFEFLGLDLAGRRRARGTVLKEIKKEIKKRFPKSR